MNSEGFLTTTARLGVALAGFAALIAALRQQQHGGWTPQDVNALKLLVEHSLGATLLTLLTCLMLVTWRDEARTWKWASVSMTLFVATEILVQVYRLVEAGGNRPRSFLSLLLFWFLPSLCVLILQVVNWYGNTPTPTPFLAAVLWLLIAAGFQLLLFLKYLVVAVVPPR